MKKISDENLICIFAVILAVTVLVAPYVVTRYVTIPLIEGNQKKQTGDYTINILRANNGDGYEIVEVTDNTSQTSKKYINYLNGGMQEIKSQ